MKPKVAVIGAGIAGLTAAFDLIQKGIDVEVYEARGRVGGRILSAYIHDTVVELGGHNVNDGGDAENLQRLIRELELNLIENTADLNQLYFNGEMFINLQQLLRDKNYEFSSLQLKLYDLAAKSSTMRQVFDGFLDREEPLYKIMSVRLAGYEGGSIDQLSSLYVETLLYMLSGSIAKAHYNDGGKHNQVTFVNVKGGMSLLTQKLAQKLEGRIHLNKPLTEVSKDQDGHYYLKFNDGTQVKADRLVLSNPCTTYSSIKFGDNVIPKERLDKIKKVCYGTNAKILVPFRKVPESPYVLLNDRIAAFFAPCKKNLIVYFTGQYGCFTPETISQTYQHERHTLELGYEEFCPPYENPIYAKDALFASYTGPVGYSWPTDPYARGSYSYIGDGQESIFRDLVDHSGERFIQLFSPINGTLFFAGEHTSILSEVPGTMEAGCESGARTARSILTI